MSPNLIALLYLAAAVLFIMALRGLSSPETSRRGNLFGMVGMGIAIATTLAQIGAAGEPLTWLWIAGSVAIGGNQAGVYPLESPGGWRIIGRTALRLFDAARNPASLLQIGDRVRFNPAA